MCNHIESNTVTKQMKRAHVNAALNKYLPKKGSFEG